MTGFEWIGYTAEWLGSFFPRILHVKCTHEGVMFSGSKSKVLKPGIHFYFPIYSEPMLYPIKRQTLNLPGQVVTLNDSKEVLADVVVVYEIYDIQKALVDTYDLEDTIRDIAQGSVKRVLSDKSLEDIKDNQHKIDITLSRKIRSNLHPFGIKVIKAFITDFGKTRIIKLVGDKMSPTKL